MSNPKSVQVRCRLSSAVDGSAAQVQLTAEEHSALKLLAHTLGYGNRNVSTLIRRLAEIASGPSEGYPDVHSLVTTAAQRSGVSLGAFMRLCVLAAIKGTELEEQLRLVSEGVRDGRASA